MVLMFTKGLTSALLSFQYHTNPAQRSAPKKRSIYFYKLLELQGKENIIKEYQHNLFNFGVPDLPTLALGTSQVFFPQTKLNSFYWTLL